MNSNHFSAVILAAGQGSRIGRCKAALPFGDETALSLIVKSFNSAGIEKILIVTGNWEEETISAAQNLPVKFVRNRNHADGMFSSVCAGVAALPDNLSGFFVHPVDIPFVKPITISALARNFEPSKFVLPAHEKKEGHPVLISGEMRGALLLWKAYDVGGGLRGFLNSQSARAKKIVPVNDEGTIFDIDTEEDYSLISRSFPPKLFPA